MYFVQVVIKFCSVCHYHHSHNRHQYLIIVLDLILLSRIIMIIIAILINVIPIVVVVIIIGINASKVMDRTWRNIKSIHTIQIFKGRFCNWSFKLVSIAWQPVFIFKNISLTLVVVTAVGDTSATFCLMYDCVVYRGR